MTNILITGATGNVGSAILHNIKSDNKLAIWRGSYSSQLKPGELYFNFNDPEKTSATLSTIDILFLLRPPHISDVGKYFKPIIDACVKSSVKHIVFLSVQGAERSTIIPHNKIEAPIRKSGIPYTFIRPSYFMQNLTTTLRNDIVHKDVIFLPAGNAKFLWVDVNDIGKVIAVVLKNVNQHINKIYMITGQELYNFQEVASLISKISNRLIRYVSPNLVHFIITKKKEGLTLSYIFVMIALHYIARFERQPEITSDFQKLTGSNPCTVENFIRENKEAFNRTN